MAARSSLKFPVVNGLHIANNGHTVVVSWDNSTDSAVTLAVANNEWGAVLAGGGTGNLTRVPLKPLAFHVHTTCEHVIEGNLCALEIHLVTKVDNTTGAEVPEKCNQEDCLAVFGTIFQVREALDNEMGSVLSMNRNKLNFPLLSEPTSSLLLSRS